MLRDPRYWTFHSFIVLLIAGLLELEDQLEQGQQPSVSEFLVDVAVFSVVISFISWLSLQVVRLLNALMPWESSLFKRFAVEMMIILSMVSVLTLVASGIKNVFFFDDPEFNAPDFGFEIMALIMLIITTFLVFAYHEFISLSSAKESLELKNEVLQKQHYLAKYEALKNQLNPHFLFNSLNALSSLIYRDTEKADMFIKKFSEVFRYVLEINKERLVPLKQELRFLESYLFLQKIRYDHQLVIYQQVEAGAFQKLLPPLSLQLAIENAIKHNIISNHQQLHIWIEGTANELVIRNNYQPNNSLNESLGLGQNNLCEKYVLLGKRAPQFFLKDNFYQVHLPLLDTAAWNVYS
jgi:sensor histidine kinase YesM